MEYENELVELKHGKWLPVYKDNRLTGGKCSVCGKFRKLSSMRLLYDGYKYCHRCGAKMDKK